MTVTMLTADSKVVPLAIQTVADVGSGPLAVGEVADATAMRFAAIAEHLSPLTDASAPTALATGHA